MTFLLKTCFKLFIQAVKLLLCGGAPVRSTYNTDMLPFERRNKSFFLGFRFTRKGSSWRILVCCKAYQNQPTKPLPFQAPTPKQHLFCDEASSTLRTVPWRQTKSVSHYAGGMALSFKEQSLLIYLLLQLCAGRIAFHCCRIHLSKVEKEGVLPKILQPLSVSVDKEYSLFYLIAHSACFC